MRRAADAYVRAFNEQSVPADAGVYVTASFVSAAGGQWGIGGEMRGLSADVWGSPRRPGAKNVWDRGPPTGKIPTGTGNVRGTILLNRADTPRRLAVAVVRVGICGGRRGSGRWPTGPVVARCRAGARSPANTAATSDGVA